MLKLELTLQDINYTSAILEFLPTILENLESKNEKVKGIMGLLKNHDVDCSTLVFTILNTFTKEQLDSLIIDGVNQYQDSIIEIINGILEKQNLKVELDTLKLEKV